MCKREKESDLGTGQGLEVGYKEELGSKVYLAGDWSSKDGLDCHLCKALGSASPTPQPPMPSAVRAPTHNPAKAARCLQKGDLGREALGLIQSPYAKGRAVQGRPTKIPDMEVDWAVSQQKNSWHITTSSKPCIKRLEQTLA